MQDEPTAQQAGRGSRAGSRETTADGADVSLVFKAAEADTAPQPAIRPQAVAAPAGPSAQQPVIAAQTDAAPPGDTGQQPVIAAQTDAAPAGDTAPQPVIATESDAGPAGGSAPGRRTGGRRYRARPAPAQRWRDDEVPPVPATPFPSGFRASAVLGGLLGWCLASCLLAAWLHLAVVAGVGFCAGSALAAWFCRPAALLRLVTAVPAVFAIAEILAQLAARPAGGHRGLVLPMAEGTLLALAAVAPWLFAGTAGAVMIALFRGLPRCVRDLRAELRGRAPAARASPAPAVRRAPDRGRT